MSRNTTPETSMAGVFSLASQVEQWLTIEAALARAQGRLGIIPPAAAEEINAKARLDYIDLDRIIDGQHRTGHPFVPLIHELTVACDEPWGQYVHWGATSQDIIDTGLVLQIRTALTLFDADLELLSDHMAVQAHSHRDTLTMGRTNGQFALPMTLGHRLVGFVAELDRMRTRLAELRPRVEVGQFSGAVGTLASLGPDGPAVRTEFLRELSLQRPDTAWHVHRDNLTEIVTVLGSTARAVGKIADDVYTSLRPEFGEAVEFQPEGSVGSSTMPQKRNPFGVMGASAQAWLAQGTAAQWMTMPRADGERDARTLQLEAALLPRAFVHAHSAVTLLLQALKHIEADAGAMGRRVHEARGGIMAERVMMRLAETLGRQNAHELVHQLAGRAHDRGVGLATVLGEDPQIRDQIDADVLEALLEPSTYLGTSAQDVDDYLRRRRAGLSD